MHDALNSMLLHKVFRPEVGFIMFDPYADGNGSKNALIFDPYADRIDEIWPNIVRSEVPSVAMSDPVCGRFST